MVGRLQLTRFTELGDMENRRYLIFITALLVANSWASDKTEVSLPWGNDTFLQAFGLEYVDRHY